MTSENSVLCGLGRSVNLEPTSFHSDYTVRSGTIKDIFRPLNLID